MDWSFLASRLPDPTGAPSPVAALAVATLVAGAGYAARALTTRGSLAAVLVGAAILRWSGWPGGAALAAFFVLSSALSRIIPAPARGDAKGDRRDTRQVVANGGAAALASAVFRSEPSLALWAATTSLAAAAADTWATTLGATSQRPPRRLLVGPPVPPGTNGGMTWRGCGAAVAGALSVGAAGSLTAGDARLLFWSVPIGAAGMVLDSVLGATLQAQRWCDGCAAESDWPVHRCGQRTRHVGGVAGLDNDGVNFVATATAAGLGALAWHLAEMTWP